MADVGNTPEQTEKDVQFAHTSIMGGIDLRWLAEQLERPGYSQAGLAKALGKDSSAISRILSGDRQIKAAEVPAILTYINQGALPVRQGLSLGAAIRAARLAVDISQEQLGETLGVSRGTINRWEADAMHPTGRRLAELTAILKAPHLAEVPTPPGRAIDDGRALVAIRAMIEAGASSKAVLAFIDDILEGEG